MKCWQIFLKRVNSATPAVLIGASAALLAILALISLCFGAASVPLNTLFNSDIVKFIRIPRMLAAIFAGAGLAGAGVVLQTLLNNPLAGPSIIGVNSGAGLFSALSCLLFPLLPGLQPIAAFGGSLCAVAVIFMLAKNTGTSRTAILLSGVILNSLFMAGTEALYTFFPTLLTNVASFRAGGLSAIHIATLYPAIILIIVTCAMVWLKTDSLELLSLGDEVAHGLGLAVRQNRFLFLICSACMAGAAVSFAGLIGFLGLIVPHMIRVVSGAEIRLLFPLSIIWGGILLLVCDTFARTAFAPFELPVGIVMAAIGAPIFISILLNKKGGNR